MEDDTPMGHECQVCGMINSCICDFIPKEPIWTTKDGQKIPLSKIEDRHLLNIHRMLRQSLDDLKCYTSVIGTPWGPRGEMAQEAFDREFEDAYQCAMVSRPWLNIIDREVKRRGLAELPLKDPFTPLPELELVEDTPFGSIYKVKKK